MIRRKLVKDWMKILWDAERREARKCMRLWHETGDITYHRLAEAHAETYERLHDAWAAMRVL